MLSSISAGSARVALAIGLLFFWATAAACIWRGGRWPAIVGGVLLAIYLLAPLYALLMPVRERDPAMGAATSLLVAIVILVVALLAMLAAGVAFHRRGLVWTAFA